MTPPLRSRILAWADNGCFVWQEGVWDRVRRRSPCPLLPMLRSNPDLAHRPVHRELDLILRKIVGRRLTRHVVGRHSRRQSLTDFLERGREQAERLLPYVGPDESVLEFGGGVGRLGRWVAPHVQRFVAVDIDPVMKEYGRRLSPGIDFRDCDELPQAAVFDGAFSIAVFFHLTLAQQKQALEYVHRRLKPGGWFLVDLKIGPRTTRELPPYAVTRFTALEDFRALCEPLFTVTTVKLFNSGFLLRRKEPDALERSARLTRLAGPPPPP